MRKRDTINGKSEKKEEKEKPKDHDIKEKEIKKEPEEKGSDISKYFFSAIIKSNNNFMKNIQFKCSIFRNNFYLVL